MIYKKNIVPALGFSMLIQKVELKNENVVLDIGCGTGTLLSMTYKKILRVIFMG